MTLATVSSVVAVESNMSFAPNWWEGAAGLHVQLDATGLGRGEVLAPSHSLLSPGSVCKSWKAGRPAWSFSQVCWSFWGAGGARAFTWTLQQICTEVPEQDHKFLKPKKQEFLFHPERDLFQFGDIPRSADLQFDNFMPTVSCTGHLFSLQCSGGQNCFSTLVNNFKVDN